MRSPRCASKMAQTWIWSSMDRRDPRIGVSTWTQFGLRCSCLPKELQTLAPLAGWSAVGDARDIAAAEANLAHQERFVHASSGSWAEASAGKRSDCWDSPSKAGTDDVRSSPALRVARRLLERGAQVRGFDPDAAANAKEALPSLSVVDSPTTLVRDADLVAITTEVAAVRGADWPTLIAGMRRPIVSMAAGCLTADDRLGLGRSTSGWGVRTEHMLGTASHDDRWIQPHPSSAARSTRPSGSIPALDELFGYLRRREGGGRDGALGASALPESIDVLVVDERALLTTPRRGSGAPEASGAVPRRRAAYSSRAARREGARCGPACCPDGDLVIFADADMATPRPDPPPRRRARGPRRRARVADPGGRLRHAGDATGYRRLLGKAFHLLRPCGWSARSRTPNAGSRGSPGQPPRTCSSGSASRASCSMSRSSTSPAAAATGSRSSRSAGSTSAGRACVPGPGWRCGSPGTCSASRSCTGGAAAGPPKAREGPPGCLGTARRRSRSSRPCRSWRPRCDSRVRGRHARVRLLAYHRGPVRLLDGQQLYGHVLHADRWFRPFLLPTDFARCRAVRRAHGRAVTATGSGSPSRSCVLPYRVALLPVSRTVRWWIVFLAGWSFPFVYAVQLDRSARSSFGLLAWAGLVRRPAWLGITGALGAAIKIQPGLVLVWAVLTGRWRAAAIGAVTLVVPRSSPRSSRVSGPGAIS